MSSFPFSIEELRQLSFERQLEMICDAFEDNWMRGNVCDVGAYSRFASPEFQARILRDLIQLENECHELYGEPDQRNRKQNPPSLETSERATIPAELPALFGHYQLLRILGKGRYGIVYEADHLPTNRRVALKLSGSDEAGHNHNAFEREASNTVPISHPSVVTVWEVGEHRGVSYMASELVRGKDLRTILAHQRLPVRSAVDLLSAIASGIHAAHEKGVIHRDLKPANILIEPISADDTSLSGDQIPVPFVFDSRVHRVRIIDFGVAKKLDRTIALTMSGDIVGTPHYMSPEQAIGDSRLVDARSDLFALGVLLFELLTGQLPFPGECLVALGLIRDGKAPTLRSIRSDLPRDLDQIVAKCLRKQRVDRYQSAASLEADLNDWLSTGRVKRLRRERIAKGLVVAGAGFSLCALSWAIYASSITLMNNFRRSKTWTDAASNHESSISVRLDNWMKNGDPDALLAWIDEGDPSVTESELDQVKGENRDIIPSEAFDQRAWRIDFAKHVMTPGELDNKSGQSLAKGFCLSATTTGIKSWAKLLDRCNTSVASDVALSLRSNVKSSTHGVVLRVWAKYLEDRGDFVSLFGVLRECRPEDISHVLKSIFSAKQQAKSKLEREFASFERPLDSESLFESDESAQWCGRLGLVAYGLNEFSYVEDLIGFARDTRARTSFIRSFAMSGLSIDELLARFPTYQDDWKSTAVLSCLASVPGEDTDQAFRRICLGLISESFETHPSAGVHLASKELLKSWGMSDYVRERERSPEFQQVRSDRNWFLNSAGMQMVIIRGPVDYWKGMESENITNPAQSDFFGFRTIRTSFAVCERPVTAHDFHRSFDGNVAMTKELDWFGAKEYCKWLTVQERLPIGYEYDIVSDCEWECSVRARTVNNFGVLAFGNLSPSEELGLFHPFGLKNYGPMGQREWTRSRTGNSVDKKSLILKTRLGFEENEFPSLGQVKSYTVVGRDSRRQDFTSGPTAFRYSRRIP